MNTDDEIRDAAHARFDGNRLLLHGFGTRYTVSIKSVEKKLKALYLPTILPIWQKLLSNSQRRYDSVMVDFCR